MSGRKRRPFDCNDHIVIGRTLKKTFRDVQALQLEVARTLGKEHRAATALERALRELDQARDRLDDVAGPLWAIDDDSFCFVYYGPQAPSPDVRAFVAWRRTLRPRP
jgi:hypothetical protein